MERHRVPINALTIRDDSVRQAFYCAVLMDRRSHAAAEWHCWHVSPRVAASALLLKLGLPLQTNGKLQTSDPDVYAVGDIAAFPLTKYNTVTRQEHVANARSSGAHAVSHILSPSDTPDYDYLPFFYSREFSLSWQVNDRP